MGPDHRDRRPRGRQHRHGQDQRQPTLEFPLLVQKLVKHGKVPLTVVRQGKPLTIELPAKPRHPMLIESLKGRYPSYFIYGPLVFSPVTAEFLASFDRRAGSTRC